MSTTARRIQNVERAIALLKALLRQDRRSSADLARQVGCSAPRAVSHLNALAKYNPQALATDPPHPGRQLRMKKAYRPCVWIVLDRERASALGRALEDRRHSLLHPKQAVLHSYKQDIHITDADREWMAYWSERRLARIARLARLQEAPHARC